MLCSDRLLVTWANKCPALCTRFALIKQNCHLASVRFSMHLFYDQTCASAGYNNCNVVELKLETNEAVCVSLECPIYHHLDKDSPLMQLWHYHQANESVKYRPPLVVVTVVGIDIKMQAQISATKVFFALALYRQLPTHRHFDQSGVLAAHLSNTSIQRTVGL